MRVLITGGAGFIGRRVAGHYLAAGHETLVVDDLSTGSAAALPAGAELIRADVAERSTAGRIARTRPDLIIHAAAQVSVRASMRNPTRDRLVNVVGTENVLHGARGVSRFVLLSSGGAIYGEAASAPESALPRPLSFYGVHKWTAERYVILSGLPYAIARPSNVYGPGQRSGLEGGVVATFCARARRRQPLIIHGDGEQRRDFVHVDDVVAAIAAMAEAGRDGTWNVGTGIATSVNELADVVEMIAGDRRPREHRAPRPGDARVSALDIAAAKADLDWSPSIGLVDGLRDLV